MGLDSRLEIYAQIENERKRPLIAYVTSGRTYAGGSIGSDAVGEISKQLEALPAECKELDLLIVSNGGDPTVAWRIVSNIRERVDKLSVLVPQAAFSAATMIALGADEIVMHPFGNLGPIDSQITTAKGRGGGKRFGSEDLTAALELARKVICEQDENHRDVMLEVFKIVCDEIDPLAIGFTSRSIQLTNAMARKMLSFHMDNQDEAAIEKIVAALHQDFFDHGYPISLTEARGIGLKASPPSQQVEQLLWKVWLEIEEELELRKPFDFMRLVRNNPDCAVLFGPTPQVLIPQGLTPEQVGAFVDHVLSTTAIVDIPPTPYNVTMGMVESSRLASRCFDRGTILANRDMELNVQLTPVMEDTGWETVKAHGSN